MLNKKRKKQKKSLFLPDLQNGSPEELIPADVTRRGLFFLSSVFLSSKELFCFSGINGSCLLAACVAGGGKAG